MSAVANNDAGDIIALASDGGNINGTTEDGVSLMHLAVKSGSLGAIGALGFLQANVEALDAAGLTPMEEAIKKDDGPCIKQLLSAGAQMYKRLFRGDTYAHFAATEKRNTALLALLEAGHEVDIKNYLGQTPLEQAVMASNAQGVDILFDKGANVNFISINEDQTPLEKADGQHNARFSTERKYKHGDTLVHRIVRSENATEMLKLVKHKLPLDIKNGDGHAPLHIASDPSVVKALLDIGADVNITTEEGDTPLHIASANGSMEVVKILYQHNAGINVKNKEGNTPLMNAVIYSQLPVATYLLFSGADPRIKNKNSWTALHYAAEGAKCDELFFDCVEMITILINAGAGVNERDIDGFTPAFVAAISDRLVLLKVLVKHGADLNLKGTRGAGIIHEVAYRGNIEVVSYLLDQGVDVNSKDFENGWTALHYAVQRGRRRVVSLLLKRGADPKVEAEDGQTPLQLAFQFRRLEAAKLLIENGA